MYDCFAQKILAVSWRIWFISLDYLLFCFRNFSSFFSNPSLVILSNAYGAIAHKKFCSLFPSKLFRLSLRLPIMVQCQLRVFASSDVWIYPARNCNCRFVSIRAFVLLVRLVCFVLCDNFCSVFCYIILWFCRRVSAKPAGKSCRRKGSSQNHEETK